MKKELGPEYYDGYSDHPLSPYWVVLYDKAIDLLPDNTDIKIAELGCGPGLFAEFLYRKGYRNYWGVDFSESCVEWAIKRVPSYQFEVGNLYDENIQKRFLDYDVFICLETFEHMTNDLAVINAIPKGKEIIFSVPNRDDEAHVRYFLDPQSVANRYSPIIDFIFGQTVPGINGKKFFLVHGEKT